VICLIKIIEKRIPFFCRPYWIKDHSIDMKKTFAALLFILLTPCLALAFQSNDARCAKGSTNDRMREEVLAVHNKYRAELEIPPLVWSETLEAHATQWANYLARSGGKLCHSKYPGEGENLWTGTANYYSNTQKVEYWASRKKFFKSGIFPYVSTTGNWLDVGHYSQMIWRRTTEVGCAKASAGTQDVFVCRYAPPGNIFTRRFDD